MKARLRAAIENFPTVAGFDCVESVREVRKQIAEETNGFSDEELIKYYDDGVGEADEEFKAWEKTQEGGECTAILNELFAAMDEDAKEYWGAKATKKAGRVKNVDINPFCEVAESKFGYKLARR